MKNSLRGGSLQNWGSPVLSDKESARQAGDMVHPWPGKISWRRKGMATHSSILAWNIHGQRSLAGYSLRDRERFRGDLATEQQQYRTQHGKHRCFSGCWLLAWVLAYSQTAGFQGYLLFYLTPWGGLCSLPSVDHFWVSSGSSCVMNSQQRKPRNTGLHFRDKPATWPGTGSQCFSASDYSTIQSAAFPGSVTCRLWVMSHCARHETGKNASSMDSRQ